MKKLLFFSLALLSTVTIASKLAASEGKVHQTETQETSSPTKTLGWGTTFQDSLWATWKNVLTELQAKTFDITVDGNSARLSKAINDLVYYSYLTELSQLLELCKDQSIEIDAHAKKAAHDFIKSQRAVARKKLQEQLDASLTPLMAMKKLQAFANTGDISSSDEEDYDSKEAAIRHIFLKPSLQKAVSLTHSDTVPTNSPTGITTPTSEPESLQSESMVPELAKETQVQEAQQINDQEKLHAVEPLIEAPVQQATQPSLVTTKPVTVTTRPQPKADPRKQSAAAQRRGGRRK